MKPAPLLLGVSAAVNIALLAWLLMPAFNPATPAASDVASARAANDPAARGSSPSRAAATATAGDDATNLASPFATEDPATLVSRLRAAGFPEQFVRRVIATETARLFAARRAAASGDSEMGYWQGRLDPLDAKHHARLQEIDREEQALQAKLLGGEAALIEFRYGEGWLKDQFGSLSPDKIARIHKLQTDYNELLQPILASMSPNINPETRAKLLLLEKERRADLAKILSAEEFLEHELRMSPTANQLRGQLVGFNPTEAEYRTLFALRHRIDEQFPLLIVAQGTPEQQQARRAAEQAADAEAKTLLGPVRYADYEQAMQGDQQLNRLVARLELPLSAAAQVAAVQRDVQQRAAATRNNRTLAPAERSAQLAALADEAAAKITAAIGRRGLEGYRLQGGQWLQNIVPRPATKK